MASKLLPASTLATLLLAVSASATTLTITPDKSSYLIGETIVLSVVGDSGGLTDNAVFGRLLFDGGLADPVSSSQETLTFFGNPWFVANLFLGVGFADAFSQASGGTPQRADGPLMASVTLLATSPGDLTYAWDIASSTFRLDFFGLTNAPGGSVTIVPEPATGLLLALGIAATAIVRRLLL